MVSDNVSDSEQLYITSGCDQSFRSDGRGCFDYREVNIENNILPHVGGSCRVRVPFHIDCVCSIKYEVCEYNPADGVPFDEGIVEYHVDVSPSLKLNDGDEITSEIALNLLNLHKSSGCIDYKALCIIPGRYYWCIYVDMLIIQCDGEPLDVSSFAAYIAFWSCKLPKLELIRGESGSYEDFNVTKDTGHVQFIDTAKFPIFISLHKIGKSLVSDATLSEIACCSYKLSLGIDSNHNFCHIVKCKAGVILHEDLQHAMAVSPTLADGLYSYFKNYMENFNLNEPQHPDVVPKRVGLLA